MPTNLLPNELVALANELNPDLNWVATTTCLGYMSEENYKKYLDKHCPIQGYQGQVVNLIGVMGAQIGGFAACCGLGMASSFYTTRYPFGGDFRLPTPEQYWKWLQTTMVNTGYGSRPAVAVHYADKGHERFSINVTAQALAKYADKVSTFRNATHDHLLSLYLIIPERARDYITETRDIKLVNYGSNVAPTNYRKVI